MAGAIVAESALKRKPKGGPEPSKKRPRSDSNSRNDGDDEQSQILLLENGIVESRKNYNNITTLIEISQKQGDNADAAVVAAVSLCRVFIRLLALGNLTRKKDASEKDETIVRWLRERLGEYKENIISMFRLDETALTALTLAMRILKAEAEHLHGNSEYIFPAAFLAEIVTALIQPEVDVSARNEFLGAFVNEHDDIRFYTFKAAR